VSTLGGDGEIKTAGLPALGVQAALFFLRIDIRRSGNIEPRCEPDYEIDLNGRGEKISSFDTRNQTL